MKKLILLFFLGLTVTLSNTQNFRPSLDNSMVVISTAGLHLRENPTSKSTSLKLVSYGSRVKIIGDKEFGSDSIRLANDKKIICKWKKVNYQGQEGFMFRPYLISIRKNTFPAKRINDQFGLWYGEGTCFNNFQYDERLNWFAIGKDKNEKIISQKVRPNYYWEKGAIVDNIMLETNLDIQPEFLIGKKGDLKIDSEVQFNKISIDGFQEERKINDQMYYDKKDGSLIYCYENREVYFNYPDLRIEGILWRGDLNEDGVEDFIIQYGNKSGKIVWLQSDTSNYEKPFERVAEFTIGYCC